MTNLSDTYLNSSHCDCVPRDSVSSSNLHVHVAEILWGFDTVVANVDHLEIPYKHSLKSIHTQTITCIHTCIHTHILVEGRIRGITVHT